MRQDHPLRERYERILAELRDELGRMEEGRFKIWHSTIENRTPVDVTPQEISRTKRNIQVFEGILAGD